MVCSTHMASTKQAPVVLHSHTVSDGHGVGDRPSIQAGVLSPHRLTMIQSVPDEDTKKLFDAETNRWFATIS